MRLQIIECMRGALESRPFVLAAWLGGSDATGRTDEWSDVDRSGGLQGTGARIHGDDPKVDILDADPAQSLLDILVDVDRRPGVPDQGVDDRRIGSEKLLGVSQTDGGQPPGG